MRLIDADKLYPDSVSIKGGRLCISQSQIANAPTVDVLDKIRKEMNDLEKKTIEDVCLDECRPCVYTTFEYVRQVINKYK